MLRLGLRRRRRPLPFFGMSGCRPDERGARVSSYAEPIAALDRGGHSLGQNVHQTFEPSSAKCDLPPGTQPDLRVPAVYPGTCVWCGARSPLRCPEPRISGVRMRVALRRFRRYVRVGAPAANNKNVLAKQPLPGGTSVAKLSACNSLVYHRHACKWLDSKLRIDLAGIVKRSVLHYHADGFDRLQIFRGIPRNEKEVRQLALFD